MIAGIVAIAENIQSLRLSQLLKFDFHIVAGNVLNHRTHTIAVIVTIIAIAVIITIVAIAVIITIVAITVIVTIIAITVLWFHMITRIVTIITITAVAALVVSINFL